MRSYIKQEKILMALEHGLQNIRSSRIDICSFYNERRESADFGNLLHDVDDDT